MSRIEEALEKAMRMREAAEGPAPLVKGDLKPVGKEQTLPEFLVREAIIDASKVDPHIISLTDTSSPAYEQYRKLKARILVAQKGDFKNTIMISSADIGEGKTITAINLAVALAREIDHTVLLVDADMRKPSMHTYLGIEAECGLSEYLAGQAELSDVLIHTGIGKLVLLAAGSPPSNPSELLSSKRMKDLVQEMKHRYADRFIIFDSPPVLVAADAIALSSHVDGVILVVQAARTSEKAVRKAIDLLKGVPILGVVFNNVPDYMGKSMYPYYYHRYSRDYSQRRTGA